jgi:glycosyltransferase involved in cell wall biosynthesis
LRKNPITWLGRFIWCVCVAQAAAHGVPTVATRNGGPVDIMKTLHHGVTVDPTDSTQLGDALLRILTNRSEWDAMSKAGAHRRGQKTEDVCDEGVERSHGDSTSPVTPLSTLLCGRE